jgi:hypothetical protein
MSHRTFDDPNSIEARQALLDNRCEHGPKRHRTRRRSKKRAKLKRQQMAHKIVVTAASQRRWHSAVVAYWSGAREEHP